MKYGVPVVMIMVITLLAGCGGESFEPYGREASDARSRARPKVDRMVAEIYGDEQPIATARFDGCREGQHNWKIQDRYQYECFVERSALVRAAQSDDLVSDALQDMDARLSDLGCTPSSISLADVDTEYWQVFRERDGYGPGNLPEVRHECSDVTVAVTPAAASTLDRSARSVAIPLGDTMLESEAYPDRVAALARSDGSAMFWVINAFTPYYANEF